MVAVLDVLLLAVLAFITGRALIAWIRHQPGANPEAAYLFTTLTLGYSLLLLAGFTPGLLGIELAAAGSALIIVFPVFLLRFVAEFGRVHRLMWMVAGIGVATGVAAIVGAVAAVTPTWTIMLAGVVTLCYIIAVVAYAGTAFVRGARATEGLTRRRLRLASWGALLLGLVLVTTLASGWVSFGALPRLLSITAFILLGLAFTPPEALMRAWWALEVQRYLASLQDRDDGLEAQDRTALAALLDVSCAMLAARGAFIWFDTERGTRIVARSMDNHVRATLRRTLSEQWRRDVGLHGIRTVTTREMTPTDARIARLFQARLLAFIPLITQTHRRGTLVIALAGPSPFLHDTLRSLAVLGGLAAQGVEAAEATRREYALVLQRYRWEAHAFRREMRALAEASRLKSRFLANTSHELRTPLNAIVGFSELLAAGRLGKMDAAAREAMGDIVTAARHLQRLIEDILDLAKVEAGRLEVQPRPCDLRRLCDEVVATLQVGIHTKQLHVLVDVAEDARQAMLDPDRFRQVLYNYLANAIKFTPRDGHVAVRVGRPTTEWLRLEVQDSGPGLKTADQARIFHAFERIRPETAHGTGLGLALVKEIVEVQGGRVGVESTPGHGATFFAEWPAADTAAVRVVVAAPPGPERTALLHDLGSFGHAPHAVGTADAILKGSPDIVFLDTDLVGAQGPDLYRRILTTPARLVVVGNVPPPLDRWGLRPHAFLQKPWTIGDLEAALQAILGEAVAHG